MIADDHQLVIEGIRSLLAGEKDIEVLAEANNGLEVLSKLKHLSADIVLMDMGMPEMDGYEALLRSKEISLSKGHRTHHVWRKIHD